MKYILLNFIFLYGLLVSAQEHPIAHAKYERDIFQRFDNFTVKNGLSSNTIRRVFQDKEGYIWLGTDNGLSRYDGTRFTNFLPVKGDSLSISNQQVTSIAQTSDGYLWVGTKDGLNRLDTQTGRFTQFRTSNAPFVRDNYIRALLVCSDGYLWYDTANATLTRLNPVTMEFRHFVRQERAFTVYFNHALFETSDRKIWVGSYGAALYVLDKKTNNLSRYTEKTDQTYRGIQPVSDGYDDQKDYLWIANFAHHATIIDKKTNFKTPLLKHNGINAVTPDLQGNVWFGGCYPILNKYDPIKNTVTYFEHNDNNSQSKLGGQIYSILCDRTGVIWIGSDKGLSRLSPFKYKFTLYRSIPGFASPKSNTIKTIFQDRDDDIWFGTGDSALFCFNPTHQTYKNFRHIRNNPNTIGSRDVTGIAQEKDGTLWFSLFTAVGGGINSLNKKTGVFKRFETSDKYYWYSDLKINNDTIIVGSWGTGAMYFDKNTGDYSTVFSQFSKGFAQPDMGVHRLAADKDGNIWFNSGFVRLCAYSTKENEFFSYMPQFAPDLGRFNDLRMKRFMPVKIPIYSAASSLIYHRDNSGIVWEISASALSELNKTESKFNSYRIPFDINPMTICNSTSNNGFWLGAFDRILYFSTDTRSFTVYQSDLQAGTITTIAEVSDNKLLVSNAKGTYLASVDIRKRIFGSQKIDSTTFNVSLRLENRNVLLGGSKGLFVYEVNGHKVRKMDGEAEHTVAYAMSSLNGKCVYIGSDNGLLLYDQEQGITNSWKANPNDKDQLSANMVYSVSQTPDGSVWLGTEKGYSKLNPDNKTFTNFTNTLKDALTNNLVSLVFADSNGYTWIGTTSSFGLNRLENRSGLIDNYLHQASDSTSISDGDINAVFESADHSIWIGTATGLCKYLPLSDNFRRYNQNKDFESNDIRSIEEDGAGNLWLGTATGLIKFNPDTKRCTNYTWKDGVQPGVFNNKSSIRLKSGQLVFGGDEGFNMFYPESIKSNPILPNPLITSVQINDSICYLANPKELRLKYSERNIELRFSSSDYNFPENNKIEYKLEGFDKDFKTGMQGVSAVYTNLSPGNYRFILRVANNDGKWCQSPLVISIRVDYPFWMHWWAILLEILALSGLIVLFLKIQSKRLVFRNKLLENEVTFQTKKLQLKNEEIAVQQELVSSQKEHIQKLYDELTNNMEYAKTIQQSLIPAKTERDFILGKNFYIYLPNNQLSGEFVWINQHQGNPIFVVFDSMINGIPGSILGMVYVSILEEILKESLHRSPGEILHLIQKEIDFNKRPQIQTKQFFSNIAIGIAVIDRSKMEVIFAGKQMNLYACKKGTGEVRTNMCKACSRTEDNLVNEFSDFILDVRPGDLLYLFTKGLPKLFAEPETEIEASDNLVQLLSKISTNEIDIQEIILLNQIRIRKQLYSLKDDITILGIEV